MADLLTKDGSGAAQYVKMDSGNGSASSAFVPRVGATIADGSDATLGAQADSAAGADAGTFSLMAAVKRILARITAVIALLPASLGQKTKDNSFPVTLASNGQLAVASNSLFQNVSASITRPADTSAYAAKDALATATSGGTNLTFVNVLSGSPFSSTKGRVNEVSITVNNGAAAPAGELWLFTEAVTAQNDNAPLNLSFTEAKKRLAIVTIGSWSASDSAGGVACRTVSVSETFELTSGADIYGIFVFTGAYTPTSGEIWDFRLQIAY